MWSSAVCKGDEALVFIFLWRGGAPQVVPINLPLSFWLQLTRGVPPAAPRRPGLLRPDREMETPGLKFVVQRCSSSFHGRFEYIFKYIYIYGPLGRIRCQKIRKSWKQLFATPEDISSWKSWKYKMLKQVALSPPSKRNHSLGGFLQYTKFWDKVYFFPKTKTKKSMNDQLPRRPFSHRGARKDTLLSLNCCCCFLFLNN